MFAYVGLSQNLKDLKDLHDTGLYCGSRLRKGEVFGYVGLSQNLKDLMRSQGVARGILWGLDRGWVVRTACLALLSSFSAQDSTIDEGGAPWSTTDGVRP